MKRNELVLFRLLNNKIKEQEERLVILEADLIIQSKDVEWLQEAVALLLEQKDREIMNNEK